ncbi:MAG: hypothetical protein ACRDT2_18815 [Natronosporangium sp.]
MTQPDPQPAQDADDTRNPARAAAAQQRRQHIEDQALAAAEQLDPTDDSTQARQLRETAASIRDHRTSPTEAATETAGGRWPAESLDRVVEAMREALDGRDQMPPFRPADQASDAERRLGWISAPTPAEQTGRARQATDLAVAALHVRDSLHRITPPPGREPDPISHRAAEPADEQAAADEH